MSTSTHSFLFRSLFGTALAATFCVGVGTVHASNMDSDTVSGTAVAMATANEERFTLVVEAPKSVKKGKKAVAKVKMIPKGEWHMNLVFPTSLSLTGTENAEMASAKLKAKDATLMDEQKGLEFDVEFTAPKAGSGKIDAKLKFAICIESACSPVTEKLNIDFEAK